MSDTSPPVPDLPFSLDALSDWMDTVGLPEGTIADAELLAGGTQNILVRFERGGAVYVLRHPPRHKRRNSDETMRREARVLTALTDSDVPHPAFIAGCGDVDVLGSAFYLMEPIVGYTPGVAGLPAGTDDAGRRLASEEMIDALAALGRVDIDAVGLQDFGKPQGWLERQVGRWQSQLDGYTELDGYPGPDIPAVREVGEWLTANQPSTWSPGIIHGDYHFLNVMFAPDSCRMAAIVDWELATIGDPLLDLGQLLSAWPDGGSIDVGIGGPGWLSPDEVIARYADKSGRSVDDIDWYRVLACYRLGIILEGTHARAFAGKAPVEIGDQLHATTVGLFNLAASVIGV